MTPNELLDLVKLEFQVLYVKSPQLSSMLTLALGAYQDKAGVIKKTVSDADATEISAPEDMADVVMIADAEGRWHEYTTDGETITVVVQTGKTVKPFTLSYFFNFRGMDIDEDDLPSESVGLVHDYLHALINEQNTQRARQAAMIMGIQAEYPTDADLKAIKDQVEMAMEDAQAIIPMATVY